MADAGVRRLEIPAAPPEGAGQELGLMRLLEMFQRRKWVFALTTALVFAAVGFYTLSATKLYTSKTQIEIDMRQKRGLAYDQSVVAGLPPQTAAVDTETEFMKSRALAARVVDQLNLIKDPEFGPRRTRGPLHGLKVMLLGGARRTVDQMATERARDREATIDALEKRLTVKRLGLTYIIDITATSVSPEKAAKLADAFADLYLTMQLETKYDSVARANAWLSNRLEDLREQVLSKEKAVEAYRAQSGLLTAEGSTLTEQSIAQLNLQLVQAKADLAERQARLRGVESDVASGGSAESAAEALGSTVIASLRAQQADIARQRAELATRYGAKHPDMQRISRESANIDDRIKDEIQRIVNNLRSEVNIAQRRIDSIRVGLGQTQTNLVENNVGAVKLRELERDADTTRTLYEAFLNRYKQIAEESGAEQADARIISRASLPLSPSSPNARLNIILGLLAGVAAASVAVLVLEMFERTLRRPEDVAAKLNTTCIGALPFLDRKTRTFEGEVVQAESFVLRRPLSPFGEALRGIRASVFFSNPDVKVKVLAVTSALPSEGKTTTAVGLARIAAMAGSKTILVDCDLRRRSATHALGMEVESGLTEVLFRKAALDDTIRKDEASGCDVLPLAQAEFTPKDLFNSEAMRELIETLRERYEVIILDTAPVLPLADTRVLSPLADTVVVVTRWGRTPASAVRSAMDQLRAHGARLSGVVLESVEYSLMSRLMYDKPDYYSELYQTYYIS